MREIPECLNRRYQMLDKLIKDLSSASPSGGAASPNPSTAGNEVGVKLMCDFWNILKEDPECDLPQEVHQRLCGKDSVGPYGSQQVECYLACKSKSKESIVKQKIDSVMNRVKRIHVPKESKRKICCPEVCQDGEKIPLTQVLFNIKEAASLDKQCHVRLEELRLTQRDLVEQIQSLEEREAQGMQLLKQADCMWCCMEDSYKKKILESQDRYKELKKEFKEIETNCIKWKKHKKDLEFQLGNINKCGDEIKEKIYQKNNDLKVMGMEIEDFKKRIASNTKDLDVAKNSYKSKRESSDARMETMAAQLQRLQQKVAIEKKVKTEKENEGSKYVKEAREDLQKICRVLLQKKLENEDLLAEKEALFQEIDLLKQTCDTCKERCEKREKSIAEELAKVEKDLAAFKVKCIKCHQCIDTADVRKYCTDCPRCLAKRDCLYSKDHCSPDHSMDCVCMSVKQKFLDNIFDNMYTVLERQSKTCGGKAVADCILNCLKRSRNGKLNQETRKVLQDFILSTVKKNLNLTIVGGAVKTRCEMDPETYKQLMLCLRDVTIPHPVKEDRGTPAKKDPCHRWGGIGECNCPKGPKACICNKAPKPPTDPTSCGLQPADEGASPSENTCPQRESLACSTDCGMLGMPGAADNLRREPCAGQSCPFSKNMRAAQCVLGPEPLSTAQKVHPLPSNLPKKSPQDKTATCTCGSKVATPCPCRKDTKQLRAGVTGNCNKGSCAHYRKIKKDTRNLEVSQPISADSKLNPKGQKEQSSTIPEIRNNISRNENVNKDQFKISIENKTGLSNYQFTELKYTKSGRLAMELNEQLIDMIEKKSLEDPSLFISLKKTSSGNLLVDFNAKENEVDNTHKVSIRRTSSGTRLLDIHKDVISLLKGSLDNKSDASILKSIKLATIPKKQDGSNQVRKDRAEASTSQPHDKNSEKHTSERKKDKKSHKDISRLVDSMLKSSEEFQLKKLQRTDKIDRQKLPRQDISSVFEFRSELKKLYKEGNTDVAVQIKGKDGEVQTFSTVVTKTTSGTIAIYVDNMTSLKYISFMNNEYPVFLSKISSNSYFVNFDKNGRVFNAIVRKSPSGGMLIIPESRTFIEMHSMSHINDRDLKLTIIGLQTQPLALPAILQTTPSLNYIIGLNENNKKNELLNEFMRDKKDLVVDLHKTSSGNYIIDLNIDDESDLIKQKALIYKSSSGDVKVLIQKDIFESIANLVSLDSLPNDYSHAIGKFPTSSREIHRGNLRKSKLASSDSQVYDNLKVQDKKGIFTEPQTVLRKTESGQYAAILDKDSKKVFMHNLKSFLSTNSEGLIPIKRSDSGKIIIDLNSSGKFKGHNGTLKITSSGNIYVVVDEEVMKSMTKRAKNKENHADVDTRSQQVTDLICSVSKAITTTCNAHPEDCDCDATKCVCSELQLDTFDWLTGFNPKKTKSHHKSGSFHAKKRSGVAKSSSRDKPPHIVIKPNCECEPKSKNIGCYFLVDSVCPYHQHIYDDVSNEILEITGLCNPNKKPSKNKIEFEAINNIPNEGKGHQAWDSLSYLPPQLPPFLNLDYH